MVDGTYSRTEWINEETRLNEKNLNNIEQGIEESLSRPMTVDIGKSESDTSPYTTILLGDGVTMKKISESVIKIDSQRVLFSNAEDFNSNNLNEGDVCIILNNKS